MNERDVMAVMNLIPVPAPSTTSFVIRRVVVFVIIVFIYQRQWNGL
jgi:hypothetical protein